MKSSSRKTILIIVGVVVFLLIFIGIGKSKGWIGSGKASEVTLGKVEQHTIVETVNATGKIYPETEVKISPDVSGEVIELNVQEGDSVTKGKLLAKIKPDVYESIRNQADASLKQAKASLSNSQARLSQAEAQFDNAKLTFDRNDKLHQQKVISEADYQNALVAFKNAQGELDAAKQTVKASEFSVKSFEASLKEANDNLVKTTIYAPMSGIVTSLSIEKGERVVGTSQMAGTEMMHISDLNHMEVRVDVSENDILRITEGDTADVDVDAYLGRKFKGIVTHIANSANSTSQLSTESVTNFTVKIALLKSSYSDLLGKDKDFPFKPGMSASVDILTETVRNALSVPIASVTINSDTTQGKEVVFLFDNGKAKKTPVTTGIEDNKYIQIKSGVTLGQTVITGPYNLISRNLEDGDAVKELVEDKKSQNKK